MKTYQTIVIIDSLLKIEEIDAIIEKIIRIINNNGGKVSTLERWEKKRMAYEIKKRQYGYYIEILFDAPTNLVKILERDYRLDEHILRYLTIALDKKAIAYIELQKHKKDVVAEETPEVDVLEEINADEEIELTPFEKSDYSALSTTASDQQSNGSE